MPFDIDHLRGWIGRSETRDDVLTPALAERFEATFGRDAAPAPGDPAPLLIHLCIGLPAVPEAGLSADGHPKRGGFLPPVPLPRRMWAGGAFTFHAGLRVGAEVRRVSTIRDVVAKAGRSGPLCFVTVDYEIRQDGRLAIAERHDIVYRGPERPGPPAAAAPEPAPEGAERRVLTPTPTLLFRYSALTFNTHRIHYDAPYAKAEEGYPGLVVHGPMQATLLCRMAAELAGRPPARFTFRSLSPLFDDAPVTLNAGPPEGGTRRLWTARPGGPVAMRAEAAW
ncbi:HTD2 family dehydratase [Roseivivax sp. CAU 1761]